MQIFNKTNKNNQIKTYKVMKTQKTKSAFISSMVFFYFLSFKPSFVSFLKNCYAAIVSVIFLLLFASIGILIANMITNCEYNYFYNFSCFFVFTLLLPVLGIYFCSNKIEKIINLVK